VRPHQVAGSFAEERPAFERTAREFETEKQQFDLETYLKRFA